MLISRMSLKSVFKIRHQGCLGTRHLDGEGMWAAKWVPRDFYLSHVNYHRFNALRNSKQQELSQFSETKDIKTHTKGH